MNHNDCRHSFMQPRVGGMVRTQPCPQRAAETTACRWLDLLQNAQRQKGSTSAPGVGSSEKISLMDVGEGASVPDIAAENGGVQATLPAYGQSSAGLAKAKQLHTCCCTSQL